MPDNADYCPKCGDNKADDTATDKTTDTNNTEQPANNTAPAASSTAPAPAAATATMPPPKVPQVAPKKSFICSTLSRIFLLIYSWIAIVSMLLTAVMAAVRTLVSAIANLITDIISKIVEEMLVDALTALLGAETMEALGDIEQLLQLILVPIKLIQLLYNLASLPAQIVAIAISIVVILINIAVAIFGFILARKIKTAKSKKPLIGWGIACIVVCVLMQANSLSIISGPLGIIAGLLGLVAGILILCSGEHEYGEARRQAEEENKQNK